MGLFFLRFFRAEGLEFHPGALGQDLQGLFEIPAFLFHDEAEDIPAFVALAEAAPGLPVGRDDEGRRFLIMEWAKSREVLAGAA